MPSEYQESKGFSTPRDARAERQASTLQNRFLTKGGNQVALAVTITAANATVTLNLPEPDTNYGVLVMPNWATIVHVTTKTTTTFQANFSVVAPANATIDWIVFRE